MNLKLLKAITVGMGFLIVGGLVVLGYGAMTQAGKLKMEKAAVQPEPLKSFGTLELKEPAGSEIHDISGAGQRLFLRVTGGGLPERILVLDAESGQRLGTIFASEAAKAQQAAPAPAQ
jgi:hypothetical protein